MSWAYLCLWQELVWSFAGKRVARAELTRTKLLMRSLTVGSYLRKNSNAAWMSKLRGTVRTCQCFLKGCSRSEGYSSQPECSLIQSCMQTIAGVFPRATRIRCIDTPRLAFAVLCRKSVLFCGGAVLKCSCWFWKRTQKSLAGEVSR